MLFSSYLCAQCYVDLNNSKNLAAHLNSPNHFDNLQIRANYDKQPDSDLICKICCITTNTREVMEAHKRGKEHTKKLAIKRAVESPDQGYDSPTPVKFKLSTDQSYQSLLSAFQAHLQQMDSDSRTSVNDSSHPEQQLRNSDRELTPPSSVKRTNNQMIQHVDDIVQQKPSKLTNESPEELQSTNPFHCNICNCTMNSRQTFESHMNGGQHMKKSRSVRALSMLSSPSAQDLVHLEQLHPIRPSMTVNSLSTMYSTPKINKLAASLSCLVPESNKSSIKPSPTTTILASLNQRKLVETIKRELNRLVTEDEQTIPKSFREITVDSEAKISNVSFYVYKPNDSTKASLSSSSSSSSFNQSSPSSNASSSTDSQSYDSKWNAFLADSMKLKNMFESQKVKKLVEAFASNSSNNEGLVLA